MRSAAELRINRQQTKDFIEDDVDTITLRRKVKVPDGAGGSTTTEQDVGDIQGRMVLQRQGVGVERRNVNGEVVTVDMVLVCEHDVDVRLGDLFTWEGRKFEVVWVNNLEYELSCEVASK